MNTKSANFLRLVILKSKIWICNILEIYMPRKFVRIRYDIHDNNMGLE